MRLSPIINRKDQQNNQSIQKIQYSHRKNLSLYSLPKTSPSSTMLSSLSSRNDVNTQETILYFIQRKYELESKIAEIEIKSERERMETCQLEQKKAKESDQKIANELKMNEIKPKHQNFNRASENFDRLIILDKSRKIIS